MEAAVRGQRPTSVERLLLEIRRPEEVGCIECSVPAYMGVDMDSRRRVQGEY